MESNQYGEEYFSPIVGDCISLCQDIGILLRSQYADGMWASGLAVLERFEDTITRREGIDETLAFLSILKIEPSNCRESILALALKMMLNTRLDDIEYEGL